MSAITPAGLTGAARAEASDYAAIAAEPVGAGSSDPVAVLADVAHRHGFAVADLVGRRRFAALSRARVEVVGRLRAAGLTLAEIGRLLGGRGHMAIMHLEERATLAGFGAYVAGGRPPEPARAGAERIAEVVAEAAARHGLEVADLTGPRRHAPLVRARAEAAAALRRRGLTLAQIGAALGGRHHSTIFHLLRGAGRPVETGGACDRCGKALVGSQRRWCSKRCSVRHYAAEWHRRHPEKAAEYSRRRYERRKDEYSAARRTPESRAKERERAAARRAARPPRPTHARTCDWCGREFETARPRQKRCSAECREASSAARWAAAAARWREANPEKAREVQEAARRRYAERHREEIAARERARYARKREEGAA